MSSIILNCPWTFRKPKETLIEDLSKNLSLPRSIISFLVNRGLETKGQIENHLTFSLARLNDPFLMKDMEKALSIILKAISQNKTIGIFGDFDADGVTATSLLYLFFKEIGINSHFYIPHRELEGYGLNRKGLDELIAKGSKLIITVDCGITNLEEVAYVKSRGISIIVTDHHVPLNELPLADACINPKRPDCPFPFKELSGVAVAFNLIRALRTCLYRRGHFRNEVPNLKKYLDLVALGTVSDMMPLFEDNRIFVKAGLEVLAKGGRPGLKALMEVCGIRNANISCFDIAFRLGPRINAAGRISHPLDAFMLLIEEDEKKARFLAKRLDELNQERQKQEKAMVTSVLSKLQQMEKRFSYVLWDEQWPKSLLGLVASKVVQELSHPVILLRKEGNSFSGSGRVPEGFDLFAALFECRELLSRFGGHKVAAGLKLSKENLNKFINEFENAILKQIGETALVKTLELDGRVDFFELLNNDYVRFIQWLEPFGPGYDSPLFSIKEFNVLSLRRIGERQNHLKFHLGPLGHRTNKWLELVAWGHGELFEKDWHELEIAFTPTINEWQGKKQLQLILKDARKKD